MHVTPEALRRAALSLDLRTTLATYTWKIPASTGRAHPQQPGSTSRHWRWRRTEGGAYPARQGFLSLGDPTVCRAGRKDTVPS